MKIKDLFEFGGLKNAKLIAGLSGIDKSVESVSVIEVTEPTNGRWLLKNQLSISAFYSVRDDLEAQKKIIKEVHRAGGSGIAICHIDFWLKNIDESIIKICDGLGFPLIVANSDISYIDIIIPINDRLLKIHSEKYKYSLYVQSKLIELIIKNRDIHDITKYIYNISNSGTSIIDINNKVISSMGLDTKTEELLETYCRTNFQEINEKYKNSDSMVVEIMEKEFVLQPVINGLDFYGFVSMEYKYDCVEKVNDPQLIIKYACLAIALINTKKQRLEKMKDIYFRDFLADLFTGNFRDEDTAIKRGKTVNWDIENKKILILFNINSISNKNETSICDIGEFSKNKLSPNLKMIIRRDNEKNLLGYRSDNIVVLLESEGDFEKMYKRAVKIAEDFIDYCEENFAISISIGISNMYDRVSEISRAYKEAVDSVIIGKQFSKERKIYSFLELGYIPLIQSDKLILQNTIIKKHFMDPLIKYDKEHNAELVSTLKKLLFSDLNIAEVSNEMFVHRNTLLARKRRIMEILNHNPFEMPYKLNYLILFSLDEDRN